MIKKIVVIGPESTGKSSLCRELAEHYNTLWCPEYAREYLLKHGMDYTYDDLLTIAQGQIALEENYHSRLTTHDSRPFFLDTNMYVMKVWCEFVFDKCHRYILDQIVDRKYDLYLLCNTDLPWIKDELREYPDLATREKLYKIYLDLMSNQDTAWTVISGKPEERFQKALVAVENILRV